jgi:uncharacterized protein YjbI with pentapeptide repeats
MKRACVRAVLGSLVGMALAGTAIAADLTIEQVRAEIAAATPQHRPNFAGRSLAELDLSHLDLSGANLAKADLRRTKLVGTNLTGANLAGAALNLAWVMNANFTRADLSGAVLDTLVASTGMEPRREEAASFAGANLSGAHILSRFAYDDLRGANLSHAMGAADIRNQSMGLIHADFSGADLSGANFADAALAYATFRFTKLVGANFSGAKLPKVDFSGADLSQANFTGADTIGVDFGAANLQGAQGLESMRGPRR